MTDEEYYLRFLEGDEGGLTALMERYGDSLTFYINGYLHDVHESEDMMIEAFSYLIVKKPKIAQGSFKAYLFKAGRNFALRALSKKRRKEAISFDELLQEPHSDVFVDEVIGTKERADILHSCMEELVPNHREALYLVYFEGLSHAEAAVVMRKSEKQVSDYVYRGKKALKSRLLKEGLNNA